MKTYTDLEQSKKLAKILPADSADMWWPYYYDIISDTGEYDKEPMLHKPICDIDRAIPCWSLAALLNYLREVDFFPEIDVDELTIIMNIDNIMVKADNFIDACVEMILKLHD